MEDHRKYLKPEVISRLQPFNLKARLVVEGFITGLHKSPYHGFSVEFAEHRQYMPGDDLKHIDWKIYGRTNRHYVKQYEEETNLKCTLIVDSSASMKYASPGNISKFEYASYLAGALAYLMTKQQDAVGLATYDSEVRTYMPPRSRGSFIQEILRTLDNTTPSNETGTAQALDRLAERISRRGLIIIISDFFDDTASILAALKHFRHKKHEVIAFQVLDPRELDFNFGSDAIFKDLETAEEMTTQPFQIQQAYIETMAAFTEELKRECRTRSIDYMLLNTSEPFDKAMVHYLSRRQRIGG